jgi:hypothetical protein
MSKHRVAANISMGQPVCLPASHAARSPLPQVDPLQVRRADGTVARVTLADAMAYHHRDKDQNQTSTEQPDDREQICPGVASGYQAIRFARMQLFADAVPDAADITLSVRGGMPGAWDIFELYTNTKLKRPTPQKGKSSLSIESFTFQVQRSSTGQSIRFRLRDSFIPQRFFELKTPGSDSDPPELKQIKGQIARHILSTAPEQCFDLLASGS